MARIDFRSLFHVHAGSLDMYLAIITPKFQTDETHLRTPFIRCAAEHYIADGATTFGLQYSGRE